MTMNIYTYMINHLISFIIKIITRMLPYNFYTPNKNTLHEFEAIIYLN